MCVAEGQPSTDGSAGTVVSFTAKAKGVVLGLLLTSVIFIITFFSSTEHFYLKCFIGTNSGKSEGVVWKHLP